MAYKNKSQKTAYQNSYIKKKYDRITLLVPSGQKEIIQDAAECNGESVNAFINRLIEQELDSIAAESKRLINQEFDRMGRGNGLSGSGKD